VLGGAPFSNAADGDYSLVSTRTGDHGVDFTHCHILWSLRGLWARELVPVQFPPAKTRRSATNLLRRPCLQFCHPFLHQGITLFLNP